MPCGENGAGKSTLIKILAGVYTPDAGEIRLRGEPFSPKSPKDSLDQGISVIHQELQLVPALNAVENIFLGRHPVKNRLGFVDWKEMRSAAEKLMAKLGISFDLDVPVGRLSVALQQMVAIAKALSYDAEILIMDEPTSTLTDEEIESLFDLLRTLRSVGVSIIYVSHRLNEPRKSLTGLRSCGTAIHRNPICRRNQHRRDYPHDGRPQYRRQYQG